MSDDDKTRTTMSEFAALHHCTARSLGRFVTYEGDFKLPMLRHLERESSGAPSKRLVEALADYRRQHSGFIDPQAFLTFATKAGVHNFSGFPQMIKGPDFVSIKPNAAGSTGQDHLARLSEHDGRVSSSKGRAAAEAWHELDPAVRIITHRSSFAKRYGASWEAMANYVEFDGTYTERMLEILKKESGGETGVPAERPAEEPKHGCATQALNLADETRHEATARAGLAPQMPMQAATTALLDLTEDEWARLPAVLDDATEEQWAMLQAALHEAIGQSPDRHAGHIPPAALSPPMQGRSLPK